MRHALTSRRSFVERLGLGTGGALLAPFVEGLVRQAKGQPSGRKRTVILIAGNGMNPGSMITPPEVKSKDPGLSAAMTVTDFSMPPMLQQAERYRKRLLVIDGLANATGLGGAHTASFAALSAKAAPNGTGTGNGGAAGGITIDQFIGRQKATPFKTLLTGIGRPKVTFASGYLRPEAAITDRHQLFRMLFGASANPELALGQRQILDRIRADANKVAASLAKPEKLPFEHLLASVEVLEQRASSLSKLSCPGPADAGPNPADVEAALEANVALVTIALVCGMTDVVGIAAGCGPTHSEFPAYNRAARQAGITEAIEWQRVGHEESRGRVFTAVFNYLAGVLAGVADTLQAQTEGAGTMLDNSTLVLMSDNGDDHHSSHHRWPVALIGGAGTIKADGRFVRYPLRGQSGNRPLADFYSTLAHAAGVPTDTFGGGAGAEKPKGPLEEIMI